MLSIAAAVLAIPALAACSGSDAAPRPSSTTSAPPSASSPGLEGYTDPGDGCAQAISAISYADDVLLPVGQEPYQKFDDVVRSRLAAVAGTLSLEGKDWPDEPVHQQAEKVQPLAQAAGARLPEETAAAKANRSKVLLRYRVEAATLILVCRDALPPSPAP